MLRAELWKVFVDLGSLASRNGDNHGIGGYVYQQPI